MNEMFRLLACWKSNAFEDSYCKEEIGMFMDCVSRQVTLKVGYSQGL